MSFRFSVAALLGVLVMAPVNLSAQDFFAHIISGVAGNDPIGTALGDSNAIADVVSQPLAGSGAQNSPWLKYDPDRERTAGNLAAFAEKAGRQDKAAGREISRIFASQPKLLDEIGGVMRNIGLDPHNVADAYALWWMSAWLAANQRQDTPPAGTIAAVRDQARSAFLATPDFANVGDADKQQYAEVLMLQAALLDGAMEQSAGQPEVLAKLATAAKQGALASGLDLNTMVLTEQGFVPREGVDAAGAVQSDTPAFATADDASPVTYAAIGALATLAIGGAFWLGKRAG